MRAIFAPLLLAAALSACTPAIRHQVLTPPPSAPRSEFLLEPTAIQSRAVGDEAWRENERWAAALTAALGEALQAAGKPRVAEVTAPTIRSRIYLAHGAAPVRAKRRGLQAEYVEVRIELVEPASKQVRYSTFTKVKLESSPFAEWFGWGEDTETLIEKTLRQSAQDFVSRL